MQVEIDKIDKVSWDQMLLQFDDASICQTWSFGAEFASNISHMVLKEGNKIVGCCQVILRDLFPLMKMGYAIIKWGPLYKTRGENLNLDVLRLLLREYKEEYGRRRGRLLRIELQTTDERKEVLKGILVSEGYERNLKVNPNRALKLELSPSLSDLRNDFLQKWRNCLNKAEKYNLKITEGTGDDLYKIFLMLATEMVERKNLTKKHASLYQFFQRVQADLPELIKMRIFICEIEGEPISAAICSALGDTGTYILGATAQKALKFNASYLLQWRIIQWLKEKGIRYYELGGIDPQQNPGVYHFKLGIAGRRGWDETFIGEYRGCFRFSGRMMEFLLDSLYGLRAIIK
jgi:lipid II:glycine glycyltransferase (peptidoglycan interpeptide bridge formation enzyme)